MKALQPNRIRMLSIFRLLSIPVALFIFYPIILLILGVFGEDGFVKTGRIINTLLMVEICGISGFLASLVKSRYKRLIGEHRVVLGLIIRVVMWGISFLPIIYLSTFIEDNLIVTIGIILCYLASDITGHLLYYKNYSSIITTKGVTAFTSLTICVILILFIKQASFSALPLSLFYFVFICIHFVTKNQGNIDYLMERRQHKLEHLPKPIRYYNLSLVSGLLLVILAGFLIRNPLGRAAAFVIDVVKTVVFYLIAGFVYLVNRMLTKVEIEQPEGGSQGNLGLFAPPDDSGGSISWEYIILAIALAAVIYLVIRNRRKILSHFVKFFIAFKAVLYRVFFKNKALSTVRDEQSSYYQDEVETIDRSEITPSKKMSGITMREYKRRLSDYTSLPNNDAKLRVGYTLAVDWLKLNGITIQNTDTTLDIQSKNTILDKSKLETVTHLYNYVVFGEHSLDTTKLEGLTEMLKSTVR